MLGIGRQNASRPQVRYDQLAVVAAADDALAVGRGGENGAAMHRHPPQLAARFGEHQRFFAEHEHGGTAEKMRGENGAAGVNGARSFDDGDSVAAIFDPSELQQGLAFRQSIPPDLSELLYKQWLRVHMRSKMIKHNKDLFESIDDPLALLEKLYIY